MVSSPDPSAARADGSSPDLGRIGRYRLLRLLGEGPLSQVFLARHVTLDTLVAFKMLVPAAAPLPASPGPQPQYAQRLVRGAQLLAKMDHPGVMRVLDCDVHVDADGHEQPFVVMEYREGIPLDRLIWERGSMGLASATQLLLRVTEALAHIHRLGVIHGDVKPASIMLHPDGHPCLVGFDMAVQEGAPIPRPTARQGQLPHFMSPETLQGGVATVAMDVWGVGVTYFSMLTGHFPFDLGPAEKVEAAIVDPQYALAPCSFNPRVLASVEQVIRRMTRTDPRERPADMEQVAEQIRDALGGVGDDDTRAVGRASTAPQDTIADPLGQGAPVVGQNLGRLRLQERMGTGSYGVVYRAWDQELERQVALKVLRADLADDSGIVERFRREAQAAGRVRHPNVIEIFSMGSQGKLHYFTMAFVDGPDLARILRQGTRLEPARALRLAAKLADGLQAAHEAGIIHRDLKPSNILLAGGVNPVITDFGIAQLHTKSALTDAGTILGTCRYMSPEQAVDQAVDGRADLYALGTVLYEMLTGDVPLTARSPLELLRKIQDEQPAPLGALGVQASDELERLMQDLLAKRPDFRPSSGASLLRRIQALPEWRADGEGGS